MLTMEQIETLLAQSVANGLTAPEAVALRLYLTDRAADMDGATRLEMAKQLLPLDEQAPIDTFVNEFAGQRGAAIQRGIAELNAISDSEWEGLING